MLLIAAGRAHNEVTRNKTFNSNRKTQNKRQPRRAVFLGIKRNFYRSPNLTVRIGFID